MLQNQIDNLNEKITYQDGKIVFETNKGYTSETMKYLYKCGYRASVSGIVHTLYDMDNKPITTAYSWVGLLYNTALLMA